MKKFLVFALAALTLLSLSCCGQTAAPASEAQAEAATETGVYRVIVTDDSGQPVSGVNVQFCSDTECMMGQTDADGVAAYEAESGVYTVHILKAPAQYLPDETEYVTDESFGDLNITLKAADSAESEESADVIDCPESGVVFTMPEVCKNAVGQIDLVDYGELDYGGGLFLCYSLYFARSDAEVEEFETQYEDMLSKGQDTEEFIDAFYDEVIHTDLFTILAIDGGRGLDEALEELDLSKNMFAVSEELGTAGDYRFFFLLSDPKAAEESGEIPETTPQEYKDEYFALLSENPETYIQNIQIKEPVSSFQPPEKGDVVSFQTKALDGSAADSADIFGGHKVTMINLWATWCGPCKRELPELGQLAKEFEAQGCQIIGICLDAEDDETTLEAVKILQESGADYPNYSPFEGLDDMLPARAIPTSYFVDSEGKVLTLPIVGADVEAYPERLAEALAQIG